MSATFSNQIEVLKNGIEFLPVLRVVAKSGKAGLWIVKTFALDCAERGLPAYEAEYPGDLRVRAAIEVSRRYLRGEATIDEVQAAAAAAADAAAACAFVVGARTAAHAAIAAYAAARAAARAPALGTAAAATAADAAADAAANAAEADTASADAYVAARVGNDTAYDAERRWQRAHLVKLLEAAE